MKTKTLFATAIGLTSTALTVITAGTIFLVSLVAQSSEAGESDNTFLLFCGALAATHVFALVVYMRAYRLRASGDKVIKDLLVYTRGIWVALGMFLFMIIAWTITLDALLIGAIFVAVTCSGLLVSNLLNHIGLKRLKRLQ